MISRIEDDEVAYKEELLEEQEEMKRDLVASLALQRSNSLSVRFRRQRSEEIIKQNRKNQVLLKYYTNIYVSMGTGMICIHREWLGFNILLLLSF